MYICKECKAEYKEKVEYCDCGNNTFDYIEDEQVAQSLKATKSRRTLTLEQKAELVSRGFFALCIILSIIVWAIPIGKTPAKKSSTTQQKPVSTSTPIPNIDKIWNDTPIYQPKSRQIQEQVQQQNPLDKLRQEVPLTFTPVERKKISQAEVQKKNNELVKPKTQSRKTKQVQNTKPVQSSAKSTQSKPVQAAKTSVQQPKKLNEAPLYKEPKKMTYNPNSAEMLRYKNNLRSALFTHFAVGSISGSGECSVQFAVDKTGKLINRKFSQESSNKALNDAVYYMLMSVPKFTAPPAEYNAQTIRMHFKIDNGNYEISIY